MEKASAPAGVTATSDAYNSIAYSVEAAEGQVEAGYKYMVYAGDKVIGDNVEAGKSYTKQVLMQVNIQLQQEPYVMIWMFQMRLKQQKQ